MKAPFLLPDKMQRDNPSRCNTVLILTKNSLFT